MTDNLFHICDDSFVITHRRGTYHQRQVYQRGHRLFLKVGAGFIGLTRRGTTHTDENVEEIACTFEVGYDKLGRAVRS